ncbi:MAG: isochorismate synthase [Candidatus Sericytochromatia bacterium]|nr:isochorismate synthase [Candidatus Sericytochromatia bacterium]
MISPLLLAPPAAPRAPRARRLALTVGPAARLAAPPLGVAHVAWQDPDGTLWVGCGRAAAWVVGSSTEARAAAGYEALDRCREALAQLPEAASGLRAFGALAFDPAFPVDPYGASVDLAAFAVPRWLLRVPASAVTRGGPAEAWVACGPDEPADQLEREAVALAAWAGRPSPPAVVPRGMLVPDETDRLDYEEAVRQALDAIRGGALEKVVLARPRFVEAAGHLPPWPLFLALAHRAPSTARFLLVEPEGGAFLGASPECLVALEGQAVRADVLAGTTPRDRDAAVDAARAEALRACPKNRHEHGLVREAVLATLKPFTTALQAPEQPRLLPLPNVWHLHTAVSGRLSEAATLGRLVRALHPTPAVGGTPRDRALELLAELERAGRGCYAAPVGWVGRDAAYMAVGIRSAHLRGNRAVALAGAGIVEGSDPTAEWLETERKLAPMLTALTGGAP